MVKPSSTEADNSVLGKQVDIPEQYSPSLLHRIPRDEYRQGFSGGFKVLHFVGEDVWQAYELSWLDTDGKPTASSGQFNIPAATTFLIKSKSLKPYLNSLNQKSFESSEEARSTIAIDLSKMCGDTVEVTLFQVDDLSFAGVELAGQCIDHYKLKTNACDSVKDLISYGSGHRVEESLYTHFLRSLCPVTNQPDWGSLWIEYKGEPIDPSGLLTYIVSLRSTKGFHEYLIEQIFVELYLACDLEMLSVRGLYNRRGGLDICPWRSTHFVRGPVSRINRQ